MQTRLKMEITVRLCDPKKKKKTFGGRVFVCVSQYGTN